MPKSSMATRTPKLRSTVSWSSARVGSSATLVSVSSRTSWSGGSPESRSATRTSRTRVSAEKCRALTLTDMRSGSPWAAHSAALRVVSRSSQRVIGMTCPVSSATDEEGVRRQQAPLGVLPADQRLDALHLAGVEPHDRLVVDDELVDRVAAQPGRDLQPPARRLAQPRREQVDPVAARSSSPRTSRRRRR